MHTKHSHSNHKKSKHNPDVVAFIGKPMAGKTESARVLGDRFGYTRLKFSHSLKSMIRELLELAQLSSEEIDRMIEGDLKEIPSGVFGWKSPRQAMQTLGMTCREQFGEDFFVNIFEKKAMAILESGGKVAIEDARMPNEVALVRRLGGRIIKIIPSHSKFVEIPSSNHPLENQVLEFDLEVNNCGDLSHLASSLIDALSFSDKS